MPSPLRRSGKRVVPAFGDGLGAPLEQLPALELPAEERMQLHPLQQLVHVEARVVVVEPDDQAERDLVGAERIHEASAECVGREAASRGCGSRRRAGARSPRPPSRRARRAADWASPTRCHSRQACASAPRVPSATTVILRREIGRLGVAVPVRLPSRSRPEGVVRTPRTADALHQQRIDRESGEQVDAELFGALAEPAHDLAERRRVEAGVVHRGRRRNPLRAASVMT